VGGVRLALFVAAALVLVAPAAGGAVARDYDPVFSPDGSTIAFVHRTAAAVSIQTVRADGGGRRTLVPSAAAQYLSWSPDGRSLAYSAAGDIWRVEVATRSRTRLTHDGGDTNWQPSWSPDGATIAFTRFEVCFRCTGIWLMDADGDNPREIVHELLGRRPVFSPDGTKIALSLANHLAVDTTGAPAVAGSGAYAVWSPRGAYLAYTGRGLWVHNVATGADRRLSAQITQKPSWSPDGSRIAGGGPKAAVALVRAADGSRLRLLPASTIEGGVPSWSRTGLLAYAHAGECGIDVARADGTHARRLTRAC
jgi:Tol biopolymer transport system component